MTTTATAAPVVIAPPGIPRDEWLAVRRTGIGGSDIAAVAGLDRWRSPLAVWLDKRGQYDGPEQSEAMRLGTRLEGVVADEFADRTGHRILPTPGTLARDLGEHRWQIVNPDRLVIDDTGSDEPTAVLEVKTTSAWRGDEWHPDSDTGDDAEAPAAAQLQLHHTLAVTGLPRGYLCGLIGGQRIVVVRIDRDDEMVDHLTRIGLAFWQTVLDGEQPPADHRDRSLLEHLYDIRPDTTTVLNPYDWDQARDLLRSARQAKKAATDAEDTAKARIAQMLGDAEAGIVDGRVVVTHKTQRRAGYTVAPAEYRVLREPKG